MADALEMYFLFHCKQCRCPTRLHASMLSGLIEHLPSPSTGFPSVALVCPVCTSVNSYSAPKSSDPNPDSASDRVELLPPQKTPVLDFVRMLQSEVEGCEPPVPLFAIWNNTVTAEERKQYSDTWTWADVKCSREHKVPDPRNKKAKR